MKLSAFVCLCVAMMSCNKSSDSPTETTNNATNENTGGEEVEPVQQIEDSEQKPGGKACDVRDKYSMCLFYSGSGYTEENVAQECASVAGTQQKECGIDGIVLACSISNSGGDDAKIYYVHYYSNGSTPFNQASAEKQCNLLSGIGGNSGQGLDPPELTTDISKSTKTFSCNVPTQSFCIDYGEGYSESIATADCNAGGDSATFAKTSVCLSSNLVGSCVHYPGHILESKISYYENNSSTCDILKEACTTAGGTFTCAN